MGKDNESIKVKSQVIKKRKRCFHIGPYLYVLPALVVYATFVLWPSVQTIVLSLYDIEGINIGSHRTFVGLRNFQELLRDSTFWKAFSHNAIWMVFALVVPVTIGMFLAVLLANEHAKGRTFFRTIYFLPQVLATVVVGLMWSWIYNPNYGSVNAILKAIGLVSLARGWLGDFYLALPSLLVAYSWAYYGFCMVIFLAALQSIDQALYEAAKIDGANGWQSFWNVTFPGLRNALTVILLVTMINAFKVYDLVRVTTTGGPGDATNVLSYYLYTTVFYADRVGYGAAIALANTALIVIVSVIFLAYRRKVEENW